MNDHQFLPLEKLRIADPDTYVWVKGRLAMISPTPEDRALHLLADTTIWGLAQEPGLGEAVAKGLLILLAESPDDRLTTYVDMVRQAAKTGPTLGRITATFLSVVLMQGDAFVAHFQNTVGIMLGKGTYTLTAPLEVMVELLSAGDAKAASAYLDLLAATFSQSLTYNQSLRLVYMIPKAVSGLDPRRRQWQIHQFTKIVTTDLKLVDHYAEGLEKGVSLLDETALAEFVDQALKRQINSPGAGEKFLSLSSKVGKDALASLQRAVPLLQVGAQLNRYLTARIGRAVPVKPLSELPKMNRHAPWVCSDRRHIYLPNEIDRHRAQDDNARLYRALARLEAGFIECGTYDFDLERACDRYPELPFLDDTHLHGSTKDTRCDGERFIGRFSINRLAADLFDLFEQARVGLCLNHHYPGLMRQVMPVMHSQWRKLEEQVSLHLLAPVYSELLLQTDMAQPKAVRFQKIQEQLVSMFRTEVNLDSSVEATARMVCLAYDLITTELGNRIHPYNALALPFDRHLHWDLVARSFSVLEPSVERIQMDLKEKGVRVYRSDLRNRLADQHGAISADDIAQLVMLRSQSATSTKVVVDLSEIDLELLLGQSGAAVAGSEKRDDDAYFYPEWDHHLQDYLHDHTRVSEIEVSDNLGGEFYSQTLIRHRGLLAHMRRAFELLKPEGLTLLRQWPEGDAFDYRALLDFAMDRRAGLIPSDRLFIKRLKQERDVAVMLLVDISRSTANPVAQGHTTVLDVAKEAVVLFCEALDVVGDDLAIAGFSGTGRHGVDFFDIKHFGEALTDGVKSRISVLQPQRSTRMGAAIRHAGTLLSRAEARVKLLIIVSDGFPNDLGYKSDYAIADTRRAVQEGRSRNLHVKAITVNVGSDPRLDDLYGRVHHHVIGDVRELPDKLLRLYGTLTRQ